MKVRTTLILLTLLFMYAGAFGRPNRRVDKHDRKDTHQKIERKLAVDPQVSVSVCISSGNIKVNGWDRNEVRAYSLEAADIQLNRKDEGTGPVRKVSLRVLDKASENKAGDPCDAYSELELNVPRGASVQLQTRDSDIEVSDVAVVYANTQNGDVNIEKAGKIVEAGTIGGGISLRESRGRISLHSAGGSIDASDVKPAEATDTFEARSLGGDITLSSITHASQTANTLNGGLWVAGPLTSGGRYNFRTMSGDMTLSLPENSSFQLSAKFSYGAEIITDFPITIMSQASAKPAPTPAPPAKPVPSAEPAPPADPDSVVVKVDPVVVAKIKNKRGSTPIVVDLSSLSMRRIEGVCGSGGAKLELSSFSG
ncbi:MAG TPA: DUF4097 family beta strand repeat-containing protein, partial [Pyrinomonadaceae bacterium]|nr:DUF4097 family beta strand repeat-containing protein [Pyrinomonadaceae bacterium]